MSIRIGLPRSINCCAILCLSNQARTALHRNSGPLSETMKLTEDTIRSAALAELTQSIGELDPMSEGLFAANDLQQPEQIVETRHFLERLTRISSDNANFTEREKTILYLRYLVPATERKKLRELAADMKISTSRVQRIEKRAIVKLKKQLLEEEWLSDGEIE